MYEYVLEKRKNKVSKFFYDDLQSIFNQCNKTAQIILLGDFNAKNINTLTQNIIFSNSLLQKKRL